MAVQSGGGAAEGGAEMKEPLKTVRKCAVCGKDIILQRGAGYLYKKLNYKTGKTEYFCGYTCAKKAGWKG